MDFDRREAAWASLHGLALGDALGSQFFVPENAAAYAAREVPPGRWRWTDDTEMACGIWSVLAEAGHVDQDLLARRFAERHDFMRGYGPSTNRLLRLVREGGDWRELAREPFEGRGSWGNGAAMRVAPLGAWFCDDLERVVTEAARSSEVTHMHPEGVAGGVAVAVATAVALAEERLSPGRFLDRVLEHTPAGLVREGVLEARKLLTVDEPGTASAVLGNGHRVAAHDTVPFCLWAAAKDLDDYERAFWRTAAAGGDVDTNCAIVGGIVAARTGFSALPASWLSNLEPLPVTW
ncbi:ADP-ribosylglycohydrolase family protein [Actinocorallia libanotica]|uniref:ADP-ribosylglycohydrolase family protein n=1 Tax=Actinocorallia libanotica TaxID=46162 RepID=A0ABN1QD49_9ACTN